MAEFSAPSTVAESLVAQSCERSALSAAFSAEVSASSIISSAASFDAAD